MSTMQQLIKALRRLQKMSKLTTLDTIHDLVNRLKLAPATAAVATNTIDAAATMLQNPAQHITAQQHARAATAIADSGISLFSHLHEASRLCNLNNNNSSGNQTNLHIVQNHCLHTKQKQTQFAMSSLAAEPLSAATATTPVPPTIPPAATDESNEKSVVTNGCCSKETTANTTDAVAAASAKPCFNTELSDILKFMELIGNLKHTKRTGWVLRDVNDCESISGHMYRMSMMTFLLDGSEGLNQIRCMELALVHDLAESLVGDITPFCGVSKGEKRAKEFKAMQDICELIEPRGKRIMELFEEYEEGQSKESQFVKDLDRLDMVMQAFEYEKRDDCLLKHQEFFDSTRGKFKHPFVQKLVEEIYEQRDQMARAKGATPPPPVHVPDMEENGVSKHHIGENNNSRS